MIYYRIESLPKRDQVFEHGGVGMIYYRIESVEAAATGTPPVMTAIPMIYYRIERIPSSLGATSPLTPVR